MHPEGPRTATWPPLSPDPTPQKISKDIQKTGRLTDSKGIPPLFNHCLSAVWFNVLMDSRHPRPKKCKHLKRWWMDDHSLKGCNGPASQCINIHLDGLVKRGCGIILPARYAYGFNFLTKLSEKLTLNHHLVASIACGKGTVAMLRLLPLEVLAIHSAPSWRGWPFVSWCSEYENYYDGMIEGGELI